MTIEDNTHPQDTIATLAGADREALSPVKQMPSGATKVSSKPKKAPAQKKDTTQLQSPVGQAPRKQAGVSMNKAEENANSTDGSQVKLRIPRSEKVIALKKTAKFMGMILRSVLLAIWLSLVAMGGYCKRHPIHALLLSCLLSLLVLVILATSSLHDYMILNKLSDNTISQIIEASRFTREFNAEEANAKKGIREFLEVGAPEWSQRESIRSVLFHARNEGLSIEHQAVLLAIVEIESGFNPMARAPTTTACGLFQFVKATAKRYKLATKDCMNPWLNAKAGVRHYIDNYENRVMKNTQSLVGSQKVFRLFELGYYLHHDGPTSKNPSNDLKAIVLGGTEFLLQVYAILKEEASSKQQSPSFMEQFKRNTLQIFENTYLFVMQFIQPELDGQLEKVEPSVEADQERRANEDSK